MACLVGFLSLYSVVEPYFFLLVAPMYFLGVYFDWKGFYPIRRLFLNTTALILTLYFLLQLNLEELLKPFAHITLVLLAIKSLEEKKPRDIYQMLLLNLFALAISTVYNLSPSFLLLFLLSSLLSVSTLILVNLYSSVGNLRLDTWAQKAFLVVSALLFALVLFLSPFFFFLLPRSQTPLFDLFGQKSGLKTGISDSVSLGKVGEIQQDNTVAFRVYGLPKGIKEPYWRLVVFDRYAKNTWVKVEEKSYSQPVGVGELVYTIVLEPTFDNYVPALDYPYSVLKVEGMNATPYMATGNVLRLNREVNKAIRLTLSSSRNLYLKEDPTPYLYVPSTLPPGIKKLSEELSRGAKDDKEKLKRVMDYFSKGFSYTLKLEKYEGDPLEYFLFVSKKGNCEYYASATALLLRSMGIPARVVGGYKGALWNEYGGYHIVTNSMAHVWVEAFVEGEWIRVDTTPSYTPPSLRKVSTFDLVRDAIVSFWYSNVVGYSSEKQLNLFKSLHKSIKAELNLENLRRRLFQTLLVITAFLFAYLLLKAILSLRKSSTGLYVKTRELLKKVGLARGDELPQELLYLVKDTPFRREVEFIVSIYQRHKYSPYKVYKDELEEGYKALTRLKKLIGNYRRS